MICGKDDSGQCCGNCFNPVVLIATHEREEITTKNIKSLEGKCRIILVCSTKLELEYYKKLGVTVILEPNKPLGRKWQCGVNVSVNMEPNPLIILGSDDFITDDYWNVLKTKIAEGYEFIGTTSWYNYDYHRLYICKYTNRNEDFPIGSGKAYSLKGLKKIRWKVFDTEAERKLDDRGTLQARAQNLKTYIHKEPSILAVKGKWPVMNKTEDYLRSRNISSQRINQCAELRFL